MAWVEEPRVASSCLHWYMHDASVRLGVLAMSRVRQREIELWPSTSFCTVNKAKPADEDKTTGRWTAQRPAAPALSVPEHA